MRPRILPSFLALGLGALVCAMPVTAQIVPTPRASELPITGASRPFLSAASAASPVNLAARGYAEREYLLSGQARVYDWGTDGKAAARPERVPYATRLLVRQPQDASRFSGVVVLELLNPTELHDSAPVWGLAHEEILRAGHAWVGVTVKPVAAAALRRFDAQRYAKLSFAYAQPAGCQPHPGLPGAPGSDEGLTATPNTENGLAYDILAQAAALLRSGSRENPLWEISPRRVIATGFGESGSLLITWVNALHAAQRLGDGSAVFDAYLQVAGGLAEAPLNQCAAPLPPEDARRRVGPRDAPFVSVMTMSEVPRTLALRREDSDQPEDFYRLYEVAGAAHAPLGGAGRPGSRELSLIGATEVGESPCEEPPAGFPLDLAVSGVLGRIDALLRAGTAPPRAPLLTVDPQDQRFVKDDQGNVLGGLRLPQIAVPSAAWSGRSTPRRPDVASAVFRCSLTGTARRFDAAELKQLYGSRAEYLRRFNAAVDAAVTEGFLLAADAPAVKAEAARGALQF